MTETSRISELITDLSTRSGRAIMSQLGLRSQALRDHLAALFAREPGAPGALLAEPVFEGAFGWHLAEPDMAGLASSGLLSADLIAAMANPPRELREHAFPQSRKPFTHQETCWKLLLDEVPRSVLVSSGTGSGKTECFLVPILEDLVRERSLSGSLDGVRALFLYPLNASSIASVSGSGLGVTPSAKTSGFASTTARRANLSQRPSRLGLGRSNWPAEHCARVPRRCW